MLLGIGFGFFILAGCTTQGWAGLTDWQWMMIFIILGCAFTGLHFIIKAAQNSFRKKVNREVERKIYYYLREER